MTHEEMQEKATAALHARPCPGCGMEPEVAVYFRQKADKIRCGYHCSCGAMVVNGMMVGSSPL